MMFAFCHVRQFIINFLGERNALCFENQEASWSPSSRSYEFDKAVGGAVCAIVVTVSVAVAVVVAAVTVVVVVM